MNNIQNGGLVSSIQGDIIHCNLSGEMSIAGINTIPWFINYDITRNYIYYSNSLKDNYLCKIDLTSKEETVLLKEGVYLLVYSDSKLYYINEANKNLYSYDIGSKSATRLIDEPINTFYIDGETILYSNEKGISKMNIEGGSRETLSKQVAVAISKQDDLICFIDQKDYSINYLYEGEFKRIEDSKTMNLNIYKDCIFYSNANDKSHIYRYSVDSEFNIKFIPERAQYIHIIEETMYYFNQDTKEWKYVSIFGGKPQVLED